MMRSPRQRLQESRYLPSARQRRHRHNIPQALRPSRRRWLPFLFGLTFAWITLSHSIALAQFPGSILDTSGAQKIPAQVGGQKQSPTQPLGKKRAIAAPVPQKKAVHSSTSVQSNRFPDAEASRLPLRQSQSLLPSPPSESVKSLGKALGLATVAPGTVLESASQTVDSPPDYLPDDFFAKLSSPSSPPNNIPSSGVTQTSSDIRGVWMTRSDMAVLRDRTKLRAALQELARLNFNTIYPVVWSAGQTFYPSEVAKQAGISHHYRGDQGQDILADVIEQGHQAGLAVIPWFEYGFMVPPTADLAKVHPEWLTQTRQGQRTRKQSGVPMAWLNPFRLDVQQFILRLVTEVVRQYDVDGVQFDDHLGLPRAFGYDDYTRSRYARETQRNLPFLASNQAWVQWRANEITTFVAALHQAVKRQKPTALVSLSPNLHDFAYRHYLQDWLTWVQRGWLDEVIVQLYQSDQGKFVANLNRPEIRAAQQHIPTGIGILSGLSRRPIPLAQIQRQVQAAHQQGLGVSFFFYNSLWDNAPEPRKKRLVGFQSMFPQSAPRLALQQP